jgi:hypothetical protein
MTDRVYRTPSVDDRNRELHSAGRRTASQTKRGAVSRVRSTAAWQGRRGRRLGRPSRRPGSVAAGLGPTAYSALPLLRATRTSPTISQPSSVFFRMSAPAPRRIKHHDRLHRLQGLLAGYCNPTCNPPAMAKDSGTPRYAVPLSWVAGSVGRAPISCRGVGQMPHLVHPRIVHDYCSRVRFCGAAATGVLCRPPVVGFRGRLAQEA